MRVNLLLFLLCSSCLLTFAACRSGDPSTEPTPTRGGPNIGDSLQPRGSPLAFRSCAEGWGWQRPSVDDQRRYLASLGGEFHEFASDPGALFAGAYIATDPTRSENEWHYGLFWARVQDVDNERYALARSGLWAATPNTAGCNRHIAAISLVIDYDVLEMHFDGEIVWFTARASPGHFEFVEYLLPERNTVGFTLLAEDGTWLDACCN